LQPRARTQGWFRGCPHKVGGYVAYSSFQLTHMTRDNHTVLVEWAMAARRKSENYYSVHNFTTRVSFST